MSKTDKDAPLSIRMARVKRNAEHYGCANSLAGGHWVWHSTTIEHRAAWHEEIDILVGAGEDNPGIWISREELIRREMDNGFWSRRGAESRVDSRAWLDESRRTRLVYGPWTEYRHELVWEVRECDLDTADLDRTRKRSRRCTWEPVNWHDVAHGGYRYYRGPGRSRRKIEYFKPERRATRDELHSLAAEWNTYGEIIDEPLPRQTRHSI